MHKILLTGGNGMLGRNVIEYSKCCQYNIIYPTSQELNLLDSNAIKKFLVAKQIDTVVHCAGLVGGIMANMQNPTQFLSDNLLMGVNLVNAALECGVTQLLNIGSSCMYPRNYKNPLKEEYLLQGEFEPTNEGYALAKITVAKLCEYINKQFGLDYKTLIPCNLYGSWDKFSPQVSHLVPAIVSKIYEAQLNQVDEVTIWGDGLARREFMYAKDCAAAIFFALENLSKLASYTNVGLGYDHTINQYYQIIAEVIGYTGRFNYDLSKPVGMSQKLLDINRLSQLGWQATTKLSVGVSLTYKYFIEEVVK
jgi:GDP-L-fucose synthase